MAAFASRFGDELALWAIYEQPGEDDTGSYTLSQVAAIGVGPDTPELIEGTHIHALQRSDGTERHANSGMSPPTPMWSPPAA
jgi:hypothetical protein